jgi:hypothetical protein
MKFFFREQVELVLKIKHYFNVYFWTLRTLPPRGLLGAYCLK